MKKMERNEALEIIRRERFPRDYELESFENDFWDRFEEFSNSTDLLEAFDNWLDDVDLYYERLRAEQYMESRGFPHYYD